jgi:nitrogen fixation NifU-like protein
MPDRNLYKQKIIDHYKNPRNYGEMEGADLEAHVNNTVCGDELTVYIRTDGQKIADINYKGSGCAISIAAMSILSEEIKGKTLEDIKSMEDSFVLDLLGLDAKTSRRKCALLGLKALGKAINMEEDDPCDFC